MFTGDFSLGTEVLVDVNNPGGDDTEEQSKSNDNGISNPFGEWGLSCKETGFSFILQEGWVIIIPFGEIDGESHVRSQRKLRK